MTVAARAVARLVRERHSNIHPEAVVFLEFVQIVRLQLIGEGEAWRVVGVQAVPPTPVDVKRQDWRFAADSPVNLLRLRRVVEQLGQFGREARLQPRLPL
jgi:hypothetical protein